MSDPVSLPGWPDNSAYLPRTCGTHADAIAKILYGATRDEARSLLGEGFIVTAPEVLERAAGIFEAISHKPGNRYPYEFLQADDALDLIHAFSQTLQGFEREIDMTPFSTWAHLRETMTRADDIHAVWALLNASRSKSEVALQLMTADIKRAADYYGWTR